MQEDYGIKLRGRFGPEKKDYNKITILNRCLEWRQDGIYYELDPRHAEIIVKEMEVSNAASVVSQGVETSALSEEDDPLLDREHAHKFRRIIARANFLAQDRMDIQYSVKEGARGMANPRQSHWEKLLRLAKYLKGHMRYVTKYGKQNGVYSINTYGD